MDVVASMISTDGNFRSLLSVLAAIAQQALLWVLAEKNLPKIAQAIWALPLEETFRPFVRILDYLQWKNEWVGKFLAVPAARRNMVSMLLYVSPATMHYFSLNNVSFARAKTIAGYDLKAELPDPVSLEARGADLPPFLDRHTYNTAGEV